MAEAKEEFGTWRRLVVLAEVVERKIGRSRKIYVGRRFL